MSRIIKNPQNIEFINSMNTRTRELDKISNKIKDFKINSNLKIRLVDGEIYSNVKKIKRY